MNSPDEFTGPVNIGNPSEITIKDLADKVIELTNSSSKLRFEPLPEDDPTQRQPDIGLAIAKLEWQPTVQLDDGLRKTIPHFEKLLRKI